MQCSSRSVEDQSPSSSAKTITPINIFAIHEEGLIQKTNLFDRIPPDDKKPAIQDLYVRGMFVVEVRHEETTAAFTLQDSIDCQRTTEQIPESRKSHSRSANISVEPQHLRADQANIGMTL